MPPKVDDKGTIGRNQVNGLVKYNDTIRQQD